MRRIRNLITIGLIALVIILLINFIPKLKITENKQTLSSTVEQNVENLMELTTVKYNYTNLAEYDNNLEISGFTIPFTNKTFLVKYNGYLKAGFTDIKIDVKDEKTAVVKLGEPKILDNVINEEDVYFYNEKDSAFNRLNFDELYTVLKEEKVNAEREAIENGFFNDTEKQAKLIITTFLETLKFEEVIFQ